MRAAIAWAHLVHDTVTIESLTGRDSYGDETYGAAVTYPARVVGQQKQIRSFTGAEVISQQMVIILASVVVQAEDRITLSTALVNSTADSAIRPPILGARRIPDQSGTHHCVLYLG